MNTMQTGFYKCKLCNKVIVDKPDILDEHLLSHKGIDVLGKWKSIVWDTESIYDMYYERNVTNTYANKKGEDKKTTQRKIDVGG